MTTKEVSGVIREVFQNEGYYAFYIGNVDDRITGNGKAPFKKGDNVTIEIKQSAKTNKWYAVSDKQATLGEPKHPVPTNKDNGYAGMSAVNTIDNLQCPNCHIGLKIVAS